MDGPPTEFGSWKGVPNRLRAWAGDGTRDSAVTALLAQADGDDLDWVVAIDSMIVGATSTPQARLNEALRGGLTTKAHLAVDRSGWPFKFVTAGQAGESTSFATVMVDIRVSRRGGRPRTRPDAVLRDKA